MTTQEMRFATREAEHELLKIVTKYKMNDIEIDVFYQTVANQLLTATIGWSRDRWTERR
jgi:hypothetical protein